MAFNAKAKKRDLIKLASELGKEVDESLKMIELRELIMALPIYTADVNFVKNTLETIMAERGEMEERERESIAEEKAVREQERLHAFELEKLRVQMEANRVSQPLSSVSDPPGIQPYIHLKKLMPDFNQKEDDMSLYLTLFERQLRFVNVNKEQWVAYLLGMLPNDIAQLIAREAEDRAQDFDFVKEKLLQRFKLTPEKLRQLFATHRKTQEKTWKDYYYEIRNYFEGWLEGLNIKTFEDLKNLMILDQLKKRVSPEVKNHFIDVWCEWLTPEELVEKIDAYDNLHASKVQVTGPELNKKCYPKQREYQKTNKKQEEGRDSNVKYGNRRNTGSTNEHRHENSYDDRTYRNPLSCYGCGAPGVIKAKCQKCNPTLQRNDTSSTILNNLDFYNCVMESHPSTLIEVSLCGALAAVCADTGATHSIAGEKLYNVLHKNGHKFQNSVVIVVLADGKMQKTDILKTTANIGVKGKKISTQLIVLKGAKNNRTLLGADFLKAAGIVLDLKKENWYFTETPQQKFDFIEIPSNIQSLRVTPTEDHRCQLREDEGIHLTPQQKEKLNSLLLNYEECLQSGGEPTPFIEHRINTGDQSPVAVPPYRMSPGKKENECDLNNVEIDFPTRKVNEIREEQLKDAELKKIINCFENEDKNVDYANWTDRGYLMNQGVLYRYAPESESEDAQLVIPEHERSLVLREHHDAPQAGHYGAEGTYHRIAKRYYWTGMRKYISDYVKACLNCNRYKPSHQKPSGLLQTPVPSQRFETISIDLFGPLPETQDGKRWIFIIEEVATKWVELFPLQVATAKECAITLIDEIFLRFGIPRRIISDNGSQFVSAVMQQLCFLLEIHQTFTPVYHPQANPVERKNRDLKPRLAILVQDQHTCWNEKLPSIRFALNTAKSSTTNETAAFLNFGRELRTIDDVTHDVRSVILNDNFVPEITPYLKRFAKYSVQLRDKIEKMQDQRKFYADQRRKKSPAFNPGDHVYVTLHSTSNAAKGRTSKFMPRRDGPYVILTKKSPSSYEIASLDDPQVPLGIYHASALKPFTQTSTTPPVQPIRKRGRPPLERIQPFSAANSAGSVPRRSSRNQRGRM